MGKIAYIPETGKIQIKNGKICTTCCSKSGTPEFSTCDHCCYLSQSPSAWQNDITYTLKSVVSYYNSTFYSLQGDNKNHAPVEGGSWWKTYIGCGNTTPPPPFGGIGKTPKYYDIEFQGSKTRFGVTATYSGTITIPAVCGGNVYWEGSGTAYGVAGEYEGEVFAYGLFHLNYGLGVTRIDVTAYSPPGADPLLTFQRQVLVAPICQISGTYSDSTLTVSWGPKGAL